jgi:hypothetical protein
MVNSSDVVVEDLSKESASNVRVRYLIDERQDSVIFLFDCTPSKRMVIHHWINMSTNIKCTYFKDKGF